MTTVVQHECWQTMRAQQGDKSALSPVFGDFGATSAAVASQAEDALGVQEKDKKRECTSAAGVVSLSRRCVEALRGVGEHKVGFLRVQLCRRRGRVQSCASPRPLVPPLPWTSSVFLRSPPLHHFT